MSCQPGCNTYPCVGGSVISGGTFVPSSTTKIGTCDNPPINPPAPGANLFFGSICDSEGHDFAPRNPDHEFVTSVYCRNCATVRELP